ncbi:hypothetical protein FHS96_003947 [Sphingomonas zeicaulis]|uniref:class I SAM-dependent methyltransferase n=1 Tax=Sphingomonas zeicaulis TaxID=1632740 RepID=UPI003D255452
MNMPFTLERKSRFEGLIEVLGDVAGKQVIDVGCGEGAMAQALAERGADVIGIDPFIESTDEIMLGRGSYRLAVGQADALPLLEASADIVLFVYSLHHVPRERMQGALNEAKRILKPGGTLCVAEPVAAGAAQYVMAPYHDETEVRADAVAALSAHAAPVFASETIAFFAEPRMFEGGFDAYAAEAISNMRYNGYTEEAATSEEVRRRFDEMVAIHGTTLDQPVRVNLYR